MSAKILIVYYSKTGNTKKVAEAMAAKFNADIEEIIEPTNRNGILNYMRSGSEAQKKLIVEINPPKKNPSNYDITIIGTPIWAWSMSSPVRSYLKMFREKLNNVAFFITFDGRPGNTLKDLEEFSAKAPIATWEFMSSEIKSGSYHHKFENFADKIESKLHEPSGIITLENLKVVNSDPASQSTS